MRFRLLAALTLAAASIAPLPVLAVDPPYQAQMERLAEILGSLYFLAPMCQPGGDDWRNEMANLVALDQPDEDRQQRLYGASYGGYTAYPQLYRSCTPPANVATPRPHTAAESTARHIHARYAE